MTDTLRLQALGALAVLRHTSHHDKAAILSAYLAALELQSEFALRRAVRLHELGWRVQRHTSPKPVLRLRHPRSFYQVNLQANGEPTPSVIAITSAPASQESWAALIQRFE